MDAQKQNIKHMWLLRIMQYAVTESPLSHDSDAVIRDRCKNKNEHNVVLYWYVQWALECTGSFNIETAWKSAKHVSEIKLDWK